MLASIGMIIMAKELPHFLGRDYKAHSFFEFLRETPYALTQADPKVFGLGLACLALMFVFSIPAVRRRVVVPPSLAVVVAGLVLGKLIGIDDHHTISIPADILKHGIVLPDFPGLFRDSSLIGAALTALLTLVLIDGVESLATIKAIDKVDPYRRKSDPDRTLLSMGISNILSSLAGGLTIIPGGVKSKLCIVSGGRTLWANFYNAVFLICFLAFGKGLINLIPYSALAAVLIHTGYKMCEPRIWKHVAHIGREQLLLFAFTVAVTLSTDLLVGIFAGMGLKLLLNTVFTSRYLATREGRPVGLVEASRYYAVHLGQLFTNPVVGRERVNGSYRLDFDRPLVCFNSLHLSRELANVPGDVSEVTLRVGEHVAMIDHTSCDVLMHYAEEAESRGTCKVEIVGLDRMTTKSHARTGMRLAPVPARVVTAAVVGQVYAAHIDPLHASEARVDTLAEVQSVD